MSNTEQEIWKTYPKYPWIEASNLGRVRTKDRYVTRSNGRKQFVRGHILKQQRHKSGYMYVHFSVEGKQVTLRVHRIAATCFIPNPNSYPEVNHKDNDRTNNVASNLEWCSHEYNESYKKNFGTSPTQIQGRPVIAINSETSEVLWFESQREAGRQLGFAYQNVGAIINGKQNTAGGYSFLNADKNAVEKAKAKFGDDIANKVEKLMNEHFN